MDSLYIQILPKKLLIWYHEYSKTKLHESISRFHNVKLEYTTVCEVENHLYRSILAVWSPSGHTLIPLAYMEHEENSTAAHDIFFDKITKWLPEIVRYYTFLSLFLFLKLSHNNVPFIH